MCEIFLFNFRFAIHYAAANVHHSCAMALLNAGSSVDVQDAQGCTPLHFAAAASSDDNAKYVLPVLGLEINCHQIVVMFNISVMFSGFGSRPLL